MFQESYLNFQMNFPGGVALAVVGRAWVEAPVLWVNEGDTEGVVVTDAGPAVRALPADETHRLTDYIPLDPGVLLARQGSAAE